MNERQRQYLDAMGIQIWVRRTSEPEARVAGAPQDAPAVELAAVLPDPVPQPLPETAGELRRPLSDERVISEPPSIDGMDWAELKDCVDKCARCPELEANRTRTVFGVGNRTAQWMVIGEAPGADEEMQGEPFAGRVGQLLNEMLRAMGHPRETVYIANVLKSRLPNDRDPKPEEVAQCEPYLKRQIQLVKPRIILAVGRISAQNLLRTDTSIGQLRGRVHQYEGTPLVVTYHPAYLLRSPLEKRKAWDDLRLALKTVRESATP